jgi:hypothetical protein
MTAYGNGQRDQDCVLRTIDDSYCNWCGVTGHRLHDCPEFSNELRKHVTIRKGQLTVNAAITSDSSDDIDSDLDEVKDKLDFPYLLDNLAVSCRESLP